MPTSQQADRGAPPTGLTDRARTEIFRIGEERWPNEACGVLLGDVVYELPNRSQHPQTSYHMSEVDWPQEVLFFLGSHDLAGTPEKAFDLIRVWHTHPAGEIGPSEYDIEAKEGVDPRLRFLVFTLFANEVREF